MNTLSNRFFIHFLASVAAAVACVGAVAQTSAQPSEQADSTRHRMPAESTVEPRTPSEFKFGEYHRSSKMTPGGSKGPETWGEERTDVGPPVPASDAAAQSSGMSGEGGEEESEDEDGAARVNDRKPMTAPSNAGPAGK